MRIRPRRDLRHARRAVHRGPPHPATRPSRSHHDETGRPRPGLLQLSPDAAPRRALDQPGPTPGALARPHLRVLLVPRQPTFAPVLDRDYEGCPSWLFALHRLDI